MTYKELMTLVSSGKAPPHIRVDGADYFLTSEGYLTDWMMEDVLLEDMYTEEGLEQIKIEVEE